MSGEGSARLFAAGSPGWSDAVRAALFEAPVEFVPSVERSQLALVELEANDDLEAAIASCGACPAILLVVPQLDESLAHRALTAGATDVIATTAPADELRRRVGVLARLGELERHESARASEADAQRLIFQSVVDALPLSLHVIDRQFRVVVWNRRREAGPFGRPRGEALRQDLFSIIGDDPGLRAEYERVFASGEIRVSEVHGRGSSPPRIFRVEKVPMRVESADVVSHVITIGHDVTEQRQLQRAMAQTEKMAAIGRLAAGIAHEINNPLATIAGCAESMRERLSVALSDAERDEIAEDARLVEDEAYRCKGILQNLLEFSRVEADQRMSCDLADVVRRTARLLSHNKRASSVKVEVEIDDDVPQVQASADHLVQVVLALLLNAADAAPEGTVRIRVRRDAIGAPVLSVEDDGPGMSPEVQERVFEPFFTTKPPGQGTGLGLSVAYGLVQAHEGRLEMRSALGKGTRFDIILPVATPAAAEVQR